MPSLSNAGTGVTTATGGVTGSGVTGSGVPIYLYSSPPPPPQAASKQDKLKAVNGVRKYLNGYFKINSFLYNYYYFNFTAVRLIAPTIIAQ
jgi:hypothetical protein